mmetsp:Transcript_34952/g.91471  ORF Transcript_34952/g.91471 Transcript_34952/m.91471 type:complete len:207 (-) Transcript_34952:348-968(-)
MGGTNLSAVRTQFKRPQTQLGCLRASKRRHKTLAERLHQGSYRVRCVHCTLHQDRQVHATYGNLCCSSRSLEVQCIGWIQRWPLGSRFCTHANIAGRVLLTVHKRRAQESRIVHSSGVGERIAGMVSRLGNSRTTPLRSHCLQLGCVCLGLSLAKLYATRRECSPRVASNILTPILRNKVLQEFRQCHEERDENIKLLGSQQIVSA